MKYVALKRAAQGTGETQEEDSGEERPLAAVLKLPGKEERIARFYRDGIHDLNELANRVGARVTEVATTLREKGLLATKPKDSEDAKLAYQTLEAARASVKRIDELYRNFGEKNDRAGQHEAMVVALTGFNRARWSGKHEEAELFRDWLLTH